MKNAVVLLSPQDLPPGHAPHRMKFPEIRPGGIGK